MENGIRRRARRWGVVSLAVACGSLAEPGRTARAAGQTTLPAAEGAASVDTVDRDDTAAARAAAALLDADPGVREEAVWSLGGTNRGASLPLLHQALLDPGRHVRAAAIALLADLGGDEALWALGLALGDEDAALREEVVYAAGRIGGPGALGVLRQALGDVEESVQEAAAQVLDELLRVGPPSAPPAERGGGLRESSSRPRVRTLSAGPRTRPGGRGAR